jgi:hypothetical protein
MRDIMEEKQAKASTNIKSLSGVVINAMLFFGCLLLLSSCDSDLSDDPIPYQPFPALSIQLTLPSNNALNTLGWMAFDDAGIKGIIVYRLSSTTYLAYERNCSYHPNDACATVDVHSSNLYMLDACCGSAFNFADGQPRSGPAWRPLRQYITSLNGSTLTITDEILQ